MYKFALLFVLFLTACGNENNNNVPDYTLTEPRTNGDFLSTASIGGATNLVPWLASDSSSGDITAQIYNHLLKYDKNLNVIGDLAETWDVSEDGLTFTFHLKKNILWSDGQPFTSADVKATFDAIIHPNTLTAYAGDYQLVQSMATPNVHTVQVTYASPFAPALSSWVGLAILPKHILDLDENVNETRLKSNPVGTGPFTLKSWEATKQTVLIANEKHFNGRPNLDGMRIRVLPDLDTQFLELLAQQLDVMGLKPVQFTRQLGQIETHYDAHKYLGFVYTWLGFNLKNELFADKRVRQALDFATPKQQLVDGVLLGQGEAITSIFKPETWPHNTAIQPRPYNLETAKNLLKQAGWVDTNNNGTLDKNGKEFTFTIITNQGNDQRIKSAEIIQQSWKQVGIGVKIEVQEWRTFIQNTLEPRNFEAIVLGWSLTPEPDPFDIWHSSKQKPKEFNILGYENAKMDALMVAARTTFDQAERKRLLDEFQTIMHDEQPSILLYAPYSLVAVHKRFKGVEPAPKGVAYNIEDWYVPTPLQKHISKNTVTP